MAIQTATTTTSKLAELYRDDIKINTITSAADLVYDKTTPVIIFLHFWGGSSATWSLVGPIITDKGYPITAIDFRGWGDSTGPDLEDAYSISNLADDVEGVLAEIDIPRVVLVGLSMGAKVAQLIAARGGRFSSRLCGLVLVSPSPATPLTLPADMRDQQLHAYDSEESARFVATNVLTVSYRGDDSNRTLPAFVVQDMLRGNKWAKKAWPAYGMADDVSAGVGDISVPVLVLAADKDVVEPVERVRAEVCDKIPGSKLVVIQDSGHLSPLDKPEAVAENLLEFLKEL
ncbi:alpha/beta-hydrolase [Rhypophila decipiens]|uniref:Alpha/beta-hydrolase n=1 Tax=Rhypophila decipiens TaxID=261697 RepID=A0AAN6Y4K1_9PEZI|nr:alpha/beta-hydrolase [Rhypophila decipiens]